MGMMGLSKAKRGMIMVQVPLNPLSHIHMSFTLIFASYMHKRPPDDDELDKDSIGSEDLQLDEPQAAKLHIQLKQESKTSH